MNFTQGWYDKARKVESPNFNERLAGAQFDLVVIHNISLPPRNFGTKSIEQLFTNTLDADAHPYFKTIEGLEVSSHFLIRRNGEQIQFVSIDYRAWHAGQSEFQGRSACNDFSIGIELEGADDIPYTELQYQSLLSLLMDLKQAKPELAYITGHEHIAPIRKTDPGIAFDWQHVKQQIKQLSLAFKIEA